MPGEKMSKIEKASKTGFCFGVKRAINRLEKVAAGLTTCDELMRVTET